MFLSPFKVAEELIGVGRDISFSASHAACVFEADARIREKTKGCHLLAIAFSTADTLLPTPKATFEAHQAKTAPSRRVCNPYENPLNNRP